MNKAIENRIKYVKNNSIKYEDVINLPDDNCVRVRSSYFYAWLARYNWLDNTDEMVLSIFNKYLEIDKIKGFFNSGIFSSSCLICVEDLKIIMNAVENVFGNKILFFKSDVKADELDMIHDDLKNKYFMKKQEQVMQLVKKVI